MAAVSPEPEPFDRSDTGDADLSPTAGQALVGTTIAGRYLVHQLIGSGAFGDVFRVEHTDLGREFALKVLKVQHTFDEVTVKRFRREARAAAAIKHPGIVDITDFGRTEANQPFIVMEWVDARTLDAVLEEAGPLSVDKAEDIMLQVARALAMAHEAGIVHRDLKPENLLLRPDGIVKIADFGLCAFGEGDGDKRLTKMGQIFGTPYYMAPERLEAGASGSPCDVYSLGCILFELVTGEPAFEADDIMAVLRCHLMAPPVGRLLFGAVHPRLRRRAHLAVPLQGSGEAAHHGPDRRSAGVGQPSRVPRGWSDRRLRHPAGPAGRCSDGPGGDRGVVRPGRTAGPRACRPPEGQAGSARRGGPPGRRCAWLAAWGLSRSPKKAGRGPVAVRAVAVPVAPAPAVAQPPKTRPPTPVVVTPPPKVATAPAAVAAPGPAQAAPRAAKPKRRKTVHRRPAAKPAHKSAGSGLLKSY